MNAKVWFLAAGKKKVGPISKGRVLERVATGKVPSGALAWREGMADWLPVTEISEFAGALAESGEHLEDSHETASVEAPRKKSKSSGSNGTLAAKTATKAKTGTKTGRSSESNPSLKTKTKKTSRPKVESVASVESVDSAHEVRALSESGFQPLHRIERKDVWRSFGLGLSRSRVVLTLAVFGSTALVGGLIAGLGALATKLHLLLALPFLLLAGLAVYVLGCLGLGALSYSSRCQLEDRAAPSISEALSFARGKLGALALTPFLLSLAWVVPLVLLLVVSAMVKIPYLGPLGTGLLFGVHLALSGATLFLLLTAGIGSLYTPVIVAFEETGVKATFRVLLDFVQRSTARILLWGALPSMAQVPFSGLVIGVGAAILLPALMLVFLMAGGPQLGSWLARLGAGDPPVAGLSVGLVPLMIWVGLFLSAVAAVLASVQNSMLSLLYLGGRQGNDELISRDSYLEQKLLTAKGA